MPVGPASSSRVARRGDVLQRRGESGHGLPFAPARDVLRRVADVDVALVAIEQRRGDRPVAIGGVAVADAADVAVDAEDLLRDDEPAARRSGGIGTIGGKPESVRRSEVDHLSHRPFLLRHATVLVCSLSHRPRDAAQAPPRRDPSRAPESRTRSAIFRPCHDRHLPLPRAPQRSFPAAGDGHVDLQRDVRARAAARRRQPGAGIPRLRDRPRADRPRDGGDARGAQPVSAEPRRDGAARGDRRQGGAALWPWLRPRARGDRHHRRDAGDLHDHRCARASRRRSHRVRAGLRQLHSRRAARRRDAGSRCAHGARVSHRLDRAAPRGDAAHADDHRQHAQQPGHERALGVRLRRVRHADPRHRHRDRQRRGLRAHGLRRRAPRKPRAPPRARRPAAS